VIAVAFPIASGPGRGFLERLIAWWTGVRGCRRFGHAELRLGDSGWGRDMYWSATSTMMEGVVLRWVIMAPAGWVVVRLPEDLDDQVIEYFIQREYASPYDWAGIVRFVLPWVRPSRKRWFCSEFVACALARDPRFEVLGRRHYLFSPNRLYVKLTEILARIEREQDFSRSGAESQR
jgi:hypothetical protein